MKIVVYVSTDKVGSGCNQEVEFDDDDWNEATNAEKDEMCQEIMWDMIEWGYTEASEFEPNRYNS